MIGGLFPQVPTVKASNSHSAGVRVVYTVNDPVAKVVFTDGSEKTFLTASADNSTSSFTALSSLTPGRYTAHLLDGSDNEIAACETSVKNGGQYVLLVTKSPGGQVSSSLFGNEPSLR